MKMPHILAAVLTTITLSNQLFCSSAANAAPQPVVVELFTSEGCSDCPSADILLAALAKHQSVAGAQIIPLEEHINYWDNPKHWVDPYSLALVTNRQYEYAAKFNDDSVYTPEMVVDGSAHFVGSDQSSAVSAVEQAEHTPRAVLSLEATPSFTGKIDVSVVVTDIPQSLAGEQFALYLAVTEDDLHSRVIDGENRGKTLAHSAVTRSLDLAGYVRGAGISKITKSIPLPSSWTTHPLHLVAFLQDTTTKRISGSNEISLQ